MIDTYQAKVSGGIRPQERVVNGHRLLVIIFAVIDTELDFFPLLYGSPDI